ncbi:hypothetical protein FOCC_FOCC009467 [Frankliniella occidentalis]|uniref:Zinc transporter ZIP11 n=1 Tax=Frankliniella occidentalis TaxID=133901 RepID=A0A6J1SHC1_FRAOC|nr:zinc transporter ZIP11 [Frankliniella occidentalis]KAE8743909.1 hypothetical protein FOCC_FOCC009467 [Frankliniella occidentalis]
MLQGYGPIFQTLLGTLLTWGLTAAGAAMVAVIPGTQKNVLDSSLGFAAGVMIAASYWSLLAPAVELAEESKQYGENGEYAWCPVAIGFILGALFVLGADVLISSLGVSNPQMILALQGTGRAGKEKDETHPHYYQDQHISENATTIDVYTDSAPSRRRVKGGGDSNLSGSLRSHQGSHEQTLSSSQQYQQWRRMLLLIMAITIHNIPEGLAVGVAFGAVGSSPSASFQKARNLAIGIGIQNFPEGLAVSVPLHAAGFSVGRSLWYGQLSGLVEPIAGVLGAAFVSLAEPALPYALAFAAGAMIFVVVDDLIPEANTSGNGRLASCGAIAGFVIMMVLDTALG